VNARKDRLLNLETEAGSLKAGALTAASFAARGRCQFGWLLGSEAMIRSSSVDLSGFMSSVAIWSNRPQ
jgi:hypothetical protein